VSGRFVESELELSAHREGVKTRVCIFCQRIGTLNNHGTLRGQSGAVRGVRFWCCPRRKSHPGFGRTFSVWLAGILPGYSVPAATLACFFLAWSRLQGDVLAAWQEANTGFSTDRAYRWVKRLLRNQGEVRTQLCRARTPPPTRGYASVSSNLHGIKIYK